VGPFSFHKIWIDQCEATEGIREHFGLQNALDYLIGEKLFHFVQAVEQHSEFAAELPAFVAEIQRLFTAGQIREYLDDPEKTKYLAPREPDLEIDDLDEEGEDELWLENPVGEKYPCKRPTRLFPRPPKEEMIIPGVGTILKTPAIPLKRPAEKFRNNRDEDLPLGAWGPRQPYWDWPGPFGCTRFL
jgi:hypothetical protein